MSGKTAASAATTGSPASRKDPCVSVSIEDKRYLDFLAAETSMRTGRQWTVKEILAEIINSKRAPGASA
jgi:hypothetical protein